MSNTNTGGPAFPSGLVENAADEVDALHKGMTLRDYFAAKVMQAEMMNGVHESDFPEYAGRAYKMADAMLKARET